MVYDDEEEDAASPFHLLTGTATGGGRCRCCGILLTPLSVVDPDTGICDDCLRTLLVIVEETGLHRWWPQAVDHTGAAQRRG